MGRGAPILLVTAVALTGCGRFGFDGADGGNSGGDGGSTAFCPEIPGALVCSGFEDDYADWSPESQQQGSVSNDCPTPHSGQRCLVARIEQGGSAARGWHGYPPQGQGGMLYARAYARIEADTTIDGINILALDAYNSGVYGPDLNVTSGDLFEVYLEEAGTLGGSSVGPVPMGSWFCLHLAVFINDSGGSISAGYDGATISDGNVDTYPNGDYDYVAVGLDWTSNQQEPVTVMIDDVVVATSPVPCPL